LKSKKKTKQKNILWTFLLIVSVCWTHPYSANKHTRTNTLA